MRMFCFFHSFPPLVFTAIQCFLKVDYENYLETWFLYKWVQFPKVREQVKTACVVFIFLFLFLMNVSPIECSCLSGRIRVSLRMESTILRFIKTFMVDEMNAKLEVETWLFFFWFLKSCHFGATHNTPRVNIPKYLHLSFYRVVSEKLKSHIN